MDRIKIVYDIIIAIWQTIKPYIDNLPTTIETWNKLTEELEQKKKEINGLSSPEYKHENWLYNKMAADVMLYLGERSKDK
jgi:hypothetical protein